LFVCVLVLVLLCLAHVFFFILPVGFTFHEYVYSFSVSIMFVLITRVSFGLRYPIFVFVHFCFRSYAFLRLCRHWVVFFFENKCQAELEATLASRIEPLLPPLPHSDDDGTAATAAAVSVGAVGAGADDMATSPAGKARASDGSDSEGLFR
jgi:hypothetical protein